MGGPEQTVVLSINFSWFTRIVSLFLQCVREAEASGHKMKFYEDDPLECDAQGHDRPF